MTHRDEQSMRRRTKSTHIAESVSSSMPRPVRHIKRRSAGSLPLYPGGAEIDEVTLLNWRELRAGR
jgi:hypothetical protein